MFGPDDFADLYADLGVPASYKATPASIAQVGRAIYSEPGQGVLGGDVILTAPTLRYPVAAFVGVVRGGEFTVGVRRFKVRGAPVVTLDGLEAEVPLEEVS